MQLPSLDPIFDLGHRRMVGVKNRRRVDPCIAIRIDSRSHGIEGGKAW
jgi:hypothetical protein